MAVTKNVYALPLRKGDIREAVSDPRAHFDVLKHAVDFAVPEGTTILAAHTGVVVYVKVDSREGGSEPRFNKDKYLNRLVLQHGNGEYSEYSHLKHGGALVKLGERVREGQPIAMSGNTGFSTEPHLHFHVYRPNKTKIGWESLRIRFKDRIRIKKTEGPVTEELAPAVKELERVKKQLAKCK